MHNIIKHSNADDVSLKVSFSHSHFFISVSDNGIGFNENELNKEIRGNGLANMKERANEIKFDLNIHSILNSGTTIELERKMT